MDIQPLFDNVLIKKINKKQEVGALLTVGGENSEQVTRGVVLGVGNGKPLDDGSLRRPVIEKGMVVVFSQEYAAEVPVGDEKYYMISEERLFGIVKE